MKRLISYITVMCLLFGISAYADGSDINITELIPVQTVDGITADISQYIRISGTTEEGLYNKMLTIGIVGKNLNKSDYSNYEIIKQIIVGSDGSYSVDIPFQKGGDFVVRVGAQGIDTPDEIQITTASVDVINEFMYGIKNEYDKSQLDAKIMSDGQILGFDMTIYKELSLQKREAICDEVLSDARMAPIEDIKTAFDFSCAVIALSEQSDTDIVYDTLMHYEALYSFGSDGEYNLFKTNSELRAYVLQKLGSTTSETTTDVKNTLYEYAALYDIYDVEMDSQMTNKITSYSSYINPTYYTAFSNMSLAKKTNVAGYMRTNKAQSMADFNTKLQYVIANYDTLYPTVTTNNTSSVSKGSSSTVSMPSSPPTAISTPTAAVTVTFSDLTDVEWAKEAIDYLLDKKVVNGKEAGKFYPNDTVTRAEFVKMLMLGYGITADDDAAKTFTDVPSSHWAHQYVSIASSKGLVNGISQSEFGVNNYITREDMATLAYRVLVYFGDVTVAQSIDSNFTDFSSFSDYAKNGIMMLNKYGVLNGYPDGSFKPKNNVTRAEAAQLIYNLIQNRG